MLPVTIETLEPVAWPILYNDWHATAPESAHRAKASPFSKRRLGFAPARPIVSAG